MRNKWLYNVFALFLFIPIYAFSGGVILYEIGTADLRLASAGYSSRAEDPSTVFTNPAGMTRLKRGLEAGVQPIFLNVHFSPDDETTTSGQPGYATKWLPSGSAFYVQPISDRWSFGVGTLGYFGSDLSYNHQWVGRYYVQKTICQGLSLVSSIAYKINDCLSLGAGVNVMYGFLKQRSAVNNLLDGLKDGYFSIEDNKFGGGGILGLLYEHSCHTRFGIQYLTKVKLKFEDSPHFHNVGPILEEILNEIGIIGSTIDLHVNVPQCVMLSAYHDVSDTLSIMCDFGWQNWMEFQKATLTLSDTNQTTFRFQPNYQDTWHVAIGAEWHYSPCLTLSTGFAFDSSAVEAKDRALDFPIGRQIRFGTGFRYYRSENLIFDAAAEIQWQGDLTIDVNRGRLAGRVSGVFRNSYGAFLSGNVIWTF